MFLAATSRSGMGFYSGRFWRFDDRAATEPSAEHFRQLFLPFGVSATGDKPAVCQYGDRLYVAGGYNDNLVVDEHERVSRLGLMAPSSPPTIAGATGTGSIGYLSFWDELTDEYSPLSGGTAISGASPRTWSSLPTYEPNNFMYPEGYVSLTSDIPTRVRPTFSAGSAVDTLSSIHYLRPGDKLYDGNGEGIAHLEHPTTGDADLLYTATLFGTVTRYPTPMAKPRQRASHVCLWLSVAGGLPRLVTKARLGTTSIVEAVPTASLGEAHPGSFERFPLCSINTIYRDRLVMAGDTDALDTVYLSAIGFPERYEGFKFRTRNGEAVTGLVGTRDYCLVMTQNSTYLLQGFTEDDMTIGLQDNGIGASGHHTNVVVHGTPYVTNHQGIFMFNGTWHPVILGATRSFSRHFAANQEHYIGGYMVNNPIDKTLQLFLKDYDLVTYTKSVNDGPDLVMYENYSWVLNYETVQPQAGGGFGPGMVSTDRFWVTKSIPFESPAAYEYGYVASRLTASAHLPPEDGRAAYLYHATQYGEIYREKDEAAFNGESIILTPTYLFDQAGGYETEGKTLVKFWTHASAEETGFWACALGGDEWVGFQSFLTSTASHGIDNPARLGNRLWGVVTGRLWPNDLSNLQPSPIVTAAGFSTEKYAHEVAASFLTGASVPPWRDPDTAPDENWVATPKSVHEHPLPDRVSGRGIAFLYFMPNPKNVTWRGVGGYFVPGIATRPYFYVSVYDA